MCRDLQIISNCHCRIRCTEQVLQVTQWQLRLQGPSGAWGVGVNTKDWGGCLIVYYWFFLSFILSEIFFHVNEL